MTPLTVGDRAQQFENGSLLGLPSETAISHVMSVATKLRNLAVRTGSRLGLRGFARAREGAAAIEFGLVAAPFLGLLFAIMETAFVFFAGQSLEYAASQAGRLIMTGQQDAAKWDQAAFKNQVCARIVALFDCSSKLFVNVQKYSSFRGGRHNAALHQRPARSLQGEV